MFSNPFPNAFGLDISDLSIKLVQLQNASRGRSNPSYQLVEHRSTHLPHGLIVNGELEKPEEVRKHIESLLRGNKDAKKKPIRGHWVVASLPESQSFIKLISLPYPKDEITKASVLEAAKNHIPYDSDSYYLDWHVVPNNETGAEKTNVFIGAIPKTVANGYTYLLESLGLGVIAIELEALAVARAMITATKNYEGEARALLDLGGTRSSLIVYDHDSIQFSTSLPFSGELVTTALMRKLAIPYEEAELRKKEHGIDYQQSQGQGFGVLSGLVTNLVTEIQKALHFYATHFPNTNAVTHITMCGGTANMQHLNTVLTEQLGIETEPGKPWKNLLSKKEIPVDPQTSLSYAAAIGLALRAADNPFFTRDII